MSIIKDFSKANSNNDTNYYRDNTVMYVFIKYFPQIFLLFIWYLRIVNRYLGPFFFPSTISTHVSWFYYSTHAEGNTMTSVEMMHNCKVCLNGTSTTSWTYNNDDPLPCNGLLQLDVADDRCLVSQYPHLWTHHHHILRLSSRNCTTQPGNDPVSATSCSFMLPPLHITAANVDSSIINTYHIYCITHVLPLVKILHVIHLNPAK